MQLNQSLLKTNKLQKTTLDYRSLYNVDIAYIGLDFVNNIGSELNEKYNYSVAIFENFEEYNLALQKLSLNDIPCVILLEIDNLEDTDVIITKITTHPLMMGVILILLAKDNTIIRRNSKLLLHSSDIYYRPFDVGIITDRINFLIRFKLLKPKEGFRFHQQIEEYSPPVLSRIFSFTVAFLLILILSPVFLITALLIKMESKGPIIYKSKRAGTGYRIFNFYKFRSMVVDADKKLASLSKTNNQYKSDRDDSKQAFVKILNDPRVTKIGNFLRKTSIDELPQLFNVLKGDMMLVGNRPLPLYEAEMLTSDEFAMRFLGPAGITGLWQISKRGKADMSDAERKELDNQYAKYSSFWMDIKIMLKTIPALLQKENV